ncbi:anti-sigma factor [Methylophaga sp. 42_25_T18]|nr:anti-sigma factor [Methylophaga sp. 42_25_T18]OUR89311.1 anti-sigma factor [Methylophaga sp. 42_8_T64]
MTANQNEILSALVDGELQGQELDHALQFLDNNEQAREQLQRYQFASDVLHGNAYDNSQIDLTGRLLASLEDEPTYTANISTKQKAQVISLPQPFWKQAAGLAMAASVGALAVVGVISQPQSQLIPMLSTAAVEAPTQIRAVAASGNRWTVEEAEIADRLNTYLVDHNEYAGASGVFSYARVVSYDAGQ